MIWHKGFIRATPDEKARIDRMLRLGCACCAQEMLTYDDWPLAQPECQHVVEGQKRLGQRFTWPCCAGHHRGEWTQAQRAFRTRCPPENRAVALSSGSKPFTARYGTQRELWGGTQIMLGLPDTGWPESKAFRTEALRLTTTGEQNGT